MEDREIFGNSAIGGINTGLGGGVRVMGVFTKEPPGEESDNAIIYEYDDTNPNDPNNNVVRNTSNLVKSGINFSYISSSKRCVLVHFMA